MVLEYNDDQQSLARVSPVLCTHHPPRLSAPIFNVCVHVTLLDFLLQSLMSVCVHVTLLNSFRVMHCCDLLWLPLSEIIVPRDTTNDEIEMQQAEKNEGLNSIIHISTT